MPLIGDATRPSAAEDRAQVLSILDSAGPVEVMRNTVEYDVPLFEERALRARGIVLTAPWRLADLAAVTASAPMPRAAVKLARHATRTYGWRTVQVGQQIVKIRLPRRSSADGSWLAEVDPVKDYVLDSVSQRDPRLAQVELWTSRNRVAKVLDADSVMRALVQLEGPDDPIRGPAGWRVIGKQLAFFTSSN